MLKRITALILAIHFGLFSLEVVVADVHDGDASAAEIAKVNGSSLFSASADNAPSGDSAPGAPAQPTGHTAHVCHCVHPHGGWTQGPDALPEPPAVTQTVAAHDDPAPSQADLAVHLRPPIA